MDEGAIQQKINAGLKQLNLSLPLAAQKQLITYLKLLQKWGSVYNLTAIRTLSEFITKHVLDSLSIAPFLAGERILDLGSGAGLPGIPLAVYYPDKYFVLLDSQIKKVRFLWQVKQSLALTNVEIIHNRVENLSGDACFNTIVTRAFGSSLEVVQKSMHLCCNNGYMLIMKGQDPEKELKSLAQLSIPVKVKPLIVPGLEAKRHLIMIKSIQK